MQLGRLRTALTNEFIKQISTLGSAAKPRKYNGDLVYVMLSATDLDLVYSLQEQVSVMAELCGFVSFRGWHQAESELPNAVACFFYLKWEFVAKKLSKADLEKSKYKAELLLHLFCEKVMFFVERDTSYFNYDFKRHLLYGPVATITCHASSGSGTSFLRNTIAKIAAQYGVAALGDWVVDSDFLSHGYYVPRKSLTNVDLANLLKE